MWYKYSSAQIASTNKYIFDARAGSTSFAVNYDTGLMAVGSNLQGNPAYFSDSSGNLASYSLAVTENQYKFVNLPDQWLFVSVTTNANFVDDITFFNRYVALNEGAAVIFGPIKIYNTILTSNEVTADFNQFAARYGYATLS
jgi:hypothetical protein